MGQWLDWGYWSVFLLMLLENVVPPVPSEAIMSVAGVAVAQGRMHIVPLLVAGTAGTLLGNLFWWWLCRRLGYERLEPWVNRWGRWLTLEWEDVQRIKRYSDRWGGLTVFAFRFMPMGRTLISIPAGLMRMPFWTFMCFTTAGSLIWNFLLVALGWWLGATFREIEHWVAPIMFAIVAAILLVYLYRVLTWKPRAQR
ncbi:DedA family protein [Sphingomonas sp. HF-S3]|uniref:DedA family protein n=1 Tax=Sphingomonas rustica TaxID=3103142 RepID=A0ABV0BAH7_9SPHN